MKPQKLLFLITVLLCFSCSTKKEIFEAKVKSTNENATILTDQHNNDTITVQKEKNLIVHLASNLTTGYRWFLINSKNNTFITQISSTYEQDKNELKLLGVGGKETYTFKLNKIGKTDLRLQYSRGAQGTPEKLFSVTLNVR